MRINTTEINSVLLSNQSPNLDELQKTSSEIILFGSRTRPRAHPNSDWDILCVGTGKTRNLRTLDLVFISQDLTLQPKWTESELANHISLYGRWLFGDPGPWFELVSVTSSDQWLKSILSTAEINNPFAFEILSQITP